MNARLPGILSSSLVAGLCLAYGGGCDDTAAVDLPDPIVRFVEVFPDEETFALEIPGEDEVDTVDAPLEIIEAPLIGEPSTLRELTAAVRRYLLDLVARLTASVDRMTRGPAVIRDDDRAVWRVRTPATNHERALVMHKVDGHFEFSLWSRPLTRPSAGGAPPWAFVAFGRLTPGADGDRGRGAMWLDLDNDGVAGSHGKMSLLWSFIGDREQLEVQVFDGTPNEAQVGRLTRSFRYDNGPDGGILAYDAGLINVHQTPDRPGEERVRVFTRWSSLASSVRPGDRPTRAVRADYSALGPEIREDGFRVILGSECWRAPGGLVTYETRLGLPLDSPRPLTMFERGDIATCPFPVEEPPVVAPPGAPPSLPPRPAELDAPELGAP